MNFKPNNKRFRNNYSGNIIILSCFMTICLLTLFISKSFARDVSFSWSENTDYPSIDGYRLYYKTGLPGEALDDYDSSIYIYGASNTSYTFQGLSDLEPYSFVLTAYRGSEESAPTRAITLDINPTHPITPDIKFFLSSFIYPLLLDMTEE